MYMIWGITAIAFIMLDATFAMLFGVYLSLAALVAMLAGYAGFNALGQFGVFVCTSLLFLCWLAPKVNQCIQKLLPVGEEENKTLGGYFDEM